MGTVGRKKVHSAGQIDQLAALRFKTQVESKNLSREKIDKILENDMPGMGEGIPKGGL